MRIMIVGGGEIGSGLTKSLSKKKQDIVLIERDEDLCKALADELNATVIHGDATEPDVLEEAGVKEADVLVVVTGEDEINLLVCLVAKELSNAAIITRATKEEYKKIFLKIGVSNVVSPETSTVEELKGMILEPNIVDMAIMHKGQLDLLELEVKKKSKAANRAVVKIELPMESLVVAIKREGSFIIPQETEKLKVGDSVVLIVRKDVEEKVREIFE